MAIYFLIAIIIILIIICIVYCTINKSNGMFLMGINNFATSSSTTASSPTTTYNHIGVNNWSATNLPPNINMESIQINGVTRQYLKINFNHSSLFDNNILLCFPGGAESMFTFLNYTNFDKIGSRVIIFEGQKSINTYSFQSSFPQMFNNVENDVYFVDTVIKNNLFLSNIFAPKLFLTGKSDGAGFAVLYSSISYYKKHIKAI